MKFKRLLSVCLIGILSVTAFCYPLPVSAQVDYSYKLDETLIKKLESIDSNEVLDISIWFKDLSKNHLEKEVISEIISEINKGNLDESALQLYNYDDLSLDEKKYVKKNTNIFDTQELFEVQLNVKSSQYNDYNKRCIKDLCKNTSINDNTITYISSYLPNADMRLSKNDIYSLIKNDDVESVYLQEAVVYSENQTTVNELDDNSNNSIMTLTGIDYLKSINATGQGIKIGNIDWGLPDTSKECFATAINENRLHCVGNINSISSHITYTTAELIGEVPGVYEGIAPKADVYCIATGNPNTTGINWKDKIETLLNYNVNIINSSFEALGDGRNNYGDCAKWIDAMINVYNVLFIQSAANDTIDSIISGGMAYNSIVVGNYDIVNQQVSSTCSSYNSGAGVYKQYKPDLVAPGNFGVYYDSNTYYCGGGTSGAAPVVTGIVALFLHKNSYGINNPMKTKAFLINGCTYLGTENTSNDTSSFVAYERKSGAGIVNGKNMHVCHSSRQWDTGTIRPNLTCSYTFLINKANKPVHITVCAMKTNTFINGNVGDSTIPSFRLEVQYGNNKTYTSSFSYDNKCSVVFTPNTSAYCTVVVTRTDNGNNSVPGTIVCGLTE